MLTKLKTKILITASALLLFTPALVPAVAHAQTDSNTIQNNLCGGTQLSLSPTGNCSTVTSQSTSDLNSILTNVVNIFSIVVGVIAVIMIIVGGMKYIVSGGESSNVSGAKNTIIFALVGLVIVALAQVIVHFVLAKVNAGSTQ